MSDNDVEEAKRDNLSGALSRCFFDECLSVECSTAGNDSPLCLAIVEIDRFDTLHTKFGASVIDAILREAASRLARRLEPTDLLARFDDKCFAIFMRLTEPSGGEAGADIARDEIANTPFVVEGLTISVTASVGVASLRTEPTLRNANFLVEHTLENLSIAKLAGRSRVEAE